MTDSPDITEVKECFRAGDDAKLLDAFQRFIASDKWPTSCHKWGEENAEEFSAFIQHIVPLLPVSTPVDVVGKLCRNYMLSLVQEAYSAAGGMGFGWWLVEHYLSYHVDCPDGCGLGESTRGG